MDAWMAFVSIAAIIAIILLGGGLIFVVIHMLIGAFSDKKESINQNKGEVIDYNQFKQLEDAKTNEYDFERIDVAKAEKEKEELDAVKVDESFDLEEDKDDDLEEIENSLKETETKSEEFAEETEDSDDDDLEIDDLIDEISSEVADEEQETADQPAEMSDEIKAYNIDEVMSNLENDETEEETPVEEAEVAETEVVEEENNADKEEIARLKAELEALNKQLSEVRDTKVQPVVIDMTEEECVARLETLEERLKNAKRDYKINAKEYRPIKKVMNDYEKYLAKLNRKNAVVAKKKVALYGVANYVDLDKDKAEKLTNDIELLTGLRLSVNHCEEVINANKDRFPILERTNNILEEQIANLESDIEATNKTLQAIRDKKGGNK